MTTETINKSTEKPRPEPILKKDHFTLTEHKLSYIINN